MTCDFSIVRLLSLAVAIALALPSASAFADPDRAVEIYEEATRAYQNGDLRKAADLLDQAFAEHPDLVYKYNRILALQGVGDHEKALAELNALYAPMKADPDDRFDDIDDIKAQLETSIAEEKAAEEPDEPQTTSTTDGATTTDGQVSEPLPPPDQGGSNILAYSLIGGGVLIGGTGILFSTGALLPEGVLECHKKRECETRARAANTDQRKALKDSDEIADTHKLVAVSLIAGGAILAGVGVVVLLLDGGSERPAQASTTATGLDSLRISPFVGEHAGGASLQLRF